MVERARRPRVDRERRLSRGDRAELRPWDGARYRGELALSGTRRWVGYVVAGLIGSVVGGLVMLAVASFAAPDLPTREPVRTTTDVSTAPIKLLPSREPRTKTTTLLAWARGGLPVEAARALADTKGVLGTTTVVAGVEWIVGSTAPDGTRVDDWPDGYSVPFEIAAIDPESYSRFVAPVDQQTILSLGPGDIVLPETSAELRQAELGSVIDFGERRFRVSGIVANESALGYEGLVLRSEASSWDLAEPFVLLRVRRDEVRRAVDRTLDRVLEPGRAARIRAEGETPYLRQADAVMAQMHVKEAFGEFSARPMPDGSLQIDPRWVKTNIARERVPLIGHATCHRLLFPQLRGAMRALIDAGLAYEINAGDFGGCYAPRFIDWDPSGRVSHHAWGIGFDVNVQENLFGTKPDQDPRVVEIVEDWGFTWGGRWLVPDGMHFEWVRFP